eukprot:TRINITY_DN19635_c0_g1_i1.p1 TRINITY_DN19635_c0_g1~~TRINITY_DN19635_c0_g1_i1.p1  ORF type:complete len:485 (+),score=103.08 TRINITY_DN19635_c0_g1_i1:74-1456(+)
MGTCSASPQRPDAGTGAGAGPRWRSPPPGPPRAARRRPPGPPLATSPEEGAPSRRVSAPAWLPGQGNGAEKAPQGRRGSTAVSDTLPCFLVEHGRAGVGSVVSRALQLHAGRVRLRDWAGSGQVGHGRFLITGGMSSRFGVECRLDEILSDLGQVDGAGRSLSVRCHLRLLSRQKHERANGVLHADCGSYSPRGDPAVRAKKRERVTELAAQTLAQAAPLFTAGRVSRTAEIYESVALRLLNNYLTVLCPTALALLASGLVRADALETRDDNPSAASGTRLLCQVLRRCLDAQAGQPPEIFSPGDRRPLSPDGLDSSPLLRRATQWYAETRRYSWSRRRSSSDPQQPQQQLGVTERDDRASSWCSFGEEEEEELDDDDIPQTYLCPITLVCMRDPVITKHGIVYERNAIVGWVRKNHTCPSTRQELSEEDLTSMPEFKAELAEYRERVRQRSFLHDNSSG